VSAVVAGMPPSAAVAADTVVADTVAVGTAVAGTAAAVGEGIAAAEVILLL
jgi:hypothetical protein